MEAQDYAEELRQNAKEFKMYAFEYKKERALYAEALNKLTGLIYRANLSDDKAAFENKLSKLLCTPYKEEAEFYIKQFNGGGDRYSSLTTSDRLRHSIMRRTPNLKPRR